MAKAKRTVALFEVINKDKRFERAASAPPKPAASFSRKMAAEAAKLWRDKNADPETLTGPSPFKRKRVPVLIPRLKAAWQLAHQRALAMTATIRHLISRQDSVVWGAVVAFAVIGATLLMRHVSIRHDAGMAIAQSLRDGPAHPEVLLVAAPPPTAPAELSPELATDVMQAGATQASQKQSPQPAIPAIPGQRIVNMNYVLVQSYFEEKTAREACDFLNRNGIACTIERGIKGWRHDFYQVIGLQGFSHLSDPQYSEYRHKIDGLSEQFAKNPHSYKRFEPMAIKW